MRGSGVKASCPTRRGPECPGGKTGCRPSWPTFGYVNRHRVGLGLVVDAPVAERFQQGDDHPASPDRGLLHGDEVLVRVGITGGEFAAELAERIWREELAGVVVGNLSLHEDLAEEVLRFFVHSHDDHAQHVGKRREVLRLPTLGGLHVLCFDLVRVSAPRLHEREGCQPDEIRERVMAGPGPAQAVEQLEEFLVVAGLFHFRMSGNFLPVTNQTALSCGRFWTMLLRFQ